MICMPFQCTYAKQDGHNQDKKRVSANNSRLPEIEIYDNNNRYKPQRESIEDSDQNLLDEAP